MTVELKIKEIRESMGISLRELSEETGIERQKNVWKAWINLTTFLTEITDKTNKINLKTKIKKS